MNKWPASKVISMRVELLVPYARNARTHSDQQVDQIAASIKEWGWTNPVLIDDSNGVIAGHGRILAAKKIGIEQVPVMVADGWTEQQKRAYVIADNKLALNADWDHELLPLELGELKDMGADLGLIGFDDAELDVILRKSLNDDETTDADETPEPKEEIKTKTGDIWILGENRIACGDNSNKEIVNKLMAGKCVDLCFTSPPYAQQREYTKESQEKAATWDEMMQGAFSALIPSDDCQILVNLGLIHRDNEWIEYWKGWLEWMNGKGWRRFGWYVWDQGFGLPGNWNGRFAPSHEWIFHLNKKSVAPTKWVDKKNENIKRRVECESTMRTADGKTKKFTNPEASAQTTKIPDSVVRIGRQVGSDGHPAQYPVNLVTAILHSFKGVVYDPFAGSGTTIIGAEQIDRCCYAIEISPQYVDIAVRRWQKFTGEKAILESTGEEFGQ